MNKRIIVTHAPDVSTDDALFYSSHQAQRKNFTPGTLTLFENGMRVDSRQNKASIHFIVWRVAK